LSFYDINKMSHETPRSGSLYSKDIKAIFPPNVQKVIFSFYIANPVNASKKLESVALSGLGNKENNELKTKCCGECKTAFSKSLVGFGPKMAMCGDFSSGQPVSANCNSFFENNPMSVSACESY